MAVYNGNSYGMQDSLSFDLNKALFICHNVHVVHTERPYPYDSMCLATLVRRHGPLIPIFSFHYFHHKLFLHYYILLLKEKVLLHYPAKIEPDGNSFMVSFRDIPEALSAGDTIEEARLMAEDALEAAMDFYFEDLRTIPLPSPAEDGEYLIPLSPKLTEKVLKLNEARS